MNMKNCDFFYLKKYFEHSDNFDKTLSPQKIQKDSKTEIQKIKAGIQDKISKVTTSAR